MKKNLMIVLVLLLSGCILFANGETEKVESVTVREESNVLTIYSPQGDSDRGGWIVEKCKEATGLEINFLCAGGGVLSERLIAEKANLLRSLWTCSDCNVSIEESRYSAIICSKLGF